MIKIITSFFLNQNKEKIEFVNADVEKQPLSYFGDFQLVVIQNCLEDLEDPVAFLGTLKNIIFEGGYLIISADYNWSRKLQLQVSKKLSLFFPLKKIIFKNYDSIGQNPIFWTR
jgi:SAM-dependent methyltransferase